MLKAAGNKIEGHKGKWYILDKGFHNGEKVFLMEHETHGEDVAHIIVNADQKIIMEDVWNGFDDLEM
jgi:Large polyvalent protein-associated domain 18